MRAAGHPRALRRGLPRPRQPRPPGDWRSPGVASAREFVYHTIQREHDGRPLRIAVLGLSWPTDTGEWVPLAAGRPLARNHFEMIADESLGLGLGGGSRSARRPTRSSA